MPTKRVKTFAIASDIHGDLAHKPTVKAFHKFVEGFNPDIRIINGDLWDFACLRSGARDNNEEKSKSLADDWMTGEQFAQRFFSGGKEKVFIGGNHDDKRIKDLCKANDARMAGYGELMKQNYQRLFRDLGAKTLPYTKRVFYQLGDYKVLHGFASGKYTGNKHAASYGNCIFSHIHAPGFFTFEDLNGSTAINTGCLCELDHDYNSTHIVTLRQAHSWAYGVILPNGKTITHLANEIEEGKFHVSEGFKLVG